MLSRPFHSGLEIDKASSIDCLGENFKNFTIDSDAMTTPSFTVEKPTTSRQQNQNTRYSGVFLLLSCLEESPGLEVAIYGNNN